MCHVRLCLWSSTSHFRGLIATKSRPRRLNQGSGCSSGCCCSSFNRSQRPFCGRQNICRHHRLGLIKIGRALGPLTGISGLWSTDSKFPRPHRSRFRYSTDRWNCGGTVKQTPSNVRWKGRHTVVELRDCNRLTLRKVEKVPKRNSRDRLKAVAAQSRLDPRFGSVALRSTDTAMTSKPSVPDLLGR